MRNISNRALLTYQVSRSRRREMFIQHPIQSPRLILIPRNTIGYLLGRVAMEVVSLPLHGAHASVEKEEPVVHFVGFATAGWVGDFVLGLVVLLYEVLHYAAGFEEADRFAVGECVCECGDAAVRIDF